MARKRDIVGIPTTAAAMAVVTVELFSAAGVEVSASLSPALTTVYMFMLEVTQIIYNRFSIKK